MKKKKQNSIYIIENDKKCSNILPFFSETKRINDQLNKFNKDQLKNKQIK